MKTITLFAVIVIFILTGCSDSGGNSSPTGGLNWDGNNPHTSLEQRFGQAFGGSYNLQCTELAKDPLGKNPTSHTLNIGANAKTTFDGIVAYDSSAPKGIITVQKSTHPPSYYARIEDQESSIIIKLDLSAANSSSITVDLEQGNISTDYTCKRVSPRQYPNANLFKEQITNIVKQYSSIPSNLSCRKFSANDNNVPTRANYSVNDNGNITFSDTTWTTNDYENDWSVDFRFSSVASFVAANQNISIAKQSSTKGNLMYGLLSSLGQLKKTLAHNTINPALQIQCDL